MTQVDYTFYNTLYCEDYSSAEDDRIAIEETDNYVCSPELAVPVVQENAAHQQLWYPPELKINTYFKKIVKENTCYGFAKFWEIVKCVLQQLIHLNKILPEDKDEHLKHASLILARSKVH